MVAVIFADLLPLVLALGHLLEVDDPVAGGSVSLLIKLEPIAAQTCRRSEHSSGSDQNTAAVQIRTQQQRDRSEHTVAGQIRTQQQRSDQNTAACQIRTQQRVRSEHSSGSEQNKRQRVGTGGQACNEDLAQGGAKVSRGPRKPLPKTKNSPDLAHYFWED